MKRGTGKKIILLAVLLAIVGGIVYTVLTWPIYPQPRKNVDSYQQLRQDMEKTGVLVPPENVHSMGGNILQSRAGWPGPAE